MNNQQIILVSIFGYIIGAFLLSVFIDILKRVYYASKVRDVTKRFINELGFVNCFCGQQGAGKSTMASGVSNMLAEKLLNDALAKINEIRILYPKVNFELVDIYIKFCFDKGLLNSDYILFTLCKTNENIEKVFRNGYQDNLIDYVHNQENFKDYIDALISIYKNNFVYFLNRQFFCRVTKNYAMPLDYQSIAIKDRYINKDYNLFRYSVIFQDEILLAGGSNSYWQSEASEDPGISDYFRLIRHIGKKSMYYISTAQDFNRIIKARRELFNNIFEIFGHKEITVFKLKIFLLECLEGIINYIYQFICDGLNQNNLIMFKGRHDIQIRKLLNKIYLCKKKTDAKSFVKYHGYQYSDPDDYLKTLDKCTHPAKEFKLVFPLTYVYGCLNTFEYSSVHDLLSTDAMDNIFDYQFTGKPTLASREEFAKEVLKKKDAKKEKKEKDQSEIIAGPLNQEPLI